MTISKSYDLHVDASLDGQRLDKALTILLSAQIPAFSRVRLQALLEKGGVTQSGKMVDDAHRKVKTDEVFSVRIPPAISAKPKAQKMALDVVFEDKDLIVINKPAGLVVHPAPGNRDHTLVNALLAHCGKSLSGIGGVMRPGIVHRLDKDTSGLMVVAKNDVAHQALSAQFADRSLSRTYHAIVWGIPVPREGSIDAPIGRHARDRKKMSVTAKGRAALTHYKVAQAFIYTALVECNLSTGRTHQIRVHLAHIKHPVLGDPVYGRRNPKQFADFPRQALHAIKLKLLHPRTGKSMSFSAPLPKDMAALMKRLKAKTV